MRIALTVLLPLVLGTGAALAQSGPPATTGAISDKTTKAKETVAPRPRDRTTDIADCIALWDAGTHMTRQEWARTCRRVQSRLENLKLDGVAPLAKTPLKRKGAGT
jgi:hypothetical protein